MDLAAVHVALVFSESMLGTCVQAMELKSLPHFCRLVEELKAKYA